VPARELVPEYLSSADVTRRGLDMLERAALGQVRIGGCDARAEAQPGRGATTIQAR
jgi:hypothetical protein